LRRRQIFEWAPNGLAAVLKELGVHGCLNVGSRS
jgi:hypothetical protein